MTTSPSLLGSLRDVRPDQTREGRTSFRFGALGVLKHVCTWCRYTRDILNVHTWTFGMYTRRRFESTHGV